MRLARCILAQLWLLVVVLASTRTELTTTTAFDDSLYGMEFDDETGEELLRAYLPADNSFIDLQKLGDLPDPAIVLMDEDGIVKEPQIVYQVGTNEDDLPECSNTSQVCSRVDIYGEPWVERQCRCPTGYSCSRSLHADDGHTILDKTRQYKVCQPIKRLPICRFFKDVAWSIAPGAGPNNTTQQYVNCRCRPGSVAYLVKRQQHILPSGLPGFIYSFGCSPQSRMRCLPKEPCKLFTIHKKSKGHLEDVNASPLCQCPKNHRCPRRHTDPGTLASSYYGGIKGVKIYSGHCIPSHHSEQPVYSVIE